MSKKIKPNRYKPEVRQNDPSRSGSGLGIDFCLKCIMTVAVISLVSLTAIFSHDFVTQSDFFAIKTIHITGANRAEASKVLEMAGLSKGMNIFEINLFTLEKRMAAHPWVNEVKARRKLPGRMEIAIREHRPLAIVRIENLADILINQQGRPFKEYNPATDHILDLPVISGLDLTSQTHEYLFNGPLFNSVMDLLKTQGIGLVKRIEADPNTGLSVEIPDTFNTAAPETGQTLTLKLGFDQFREKLAQARKISAYMTTHLPDRIICRMDLTNRHKAFVKTKESDALQDSMNKGV